MTGAKHDRCHLWCHDVNLLWKAILTVQQPTTKYSNAALTPNYSRCWFTSKSTEYLTKCCLLSSPHSAAHLFTTIHQSVVKGKKEHADLWKLSSSECQCIQLWNEYTVYQPKPCLQTSTPISKPFNFVPLW